jgi:D-psicose/D-tagatose/L-ribulose 3-epimerase
MKYGICYCYWNKNWEGNDYPKYIERTRKCGFDILEIFYGRTLEMGKKEIEEINAAARDNDVEIYISGGFGRDMDISRSDDSERKKAVAKSIDLLQAIAKLHARNFSGINYGAWCNFDKPMNKQKLIENAAKSLREIGKVAGDYGISWNMEVVNRFESCMLNTAKEARVLTDLVDNPNINILLDIFHGMIEEDDLADAIRIAGNKLGHYHMGSNNRRLPRPCFLPWQDVCDAMKEIHYDKSISFEPLVQTGGTVALNGGNVWRPMLDENISDEQLDKELTTSLEFIRSKF